MLSRSVVAKLVERETPFYFYDMELLRKTLNIVVDESSKYNYKVHYAIKANFESGILKEVLKAGLGVDCVSGGEVRRAVESGFDPKSIVFAGVGKSDKEIRYAIEQGIFAFNVESREELKNIDTIANDMGKIVNVALRINPDVEPDTHENISTGHADSKFGIAYTEIDQVAAQLDKMNNIRITGLHFHIGSQIRDLSVFENLSARVNTLYEWFTNHGFKLTHINLGGGLGINYDDPEGEPIPDFVRYFQIFNSSLSLPKGVEIHFELGRSIVGQCGEFITRVMYNKVNGLGKSVALVDGSMSELIRPALYHAKHAIENLTSTDPEKIYTIGGTVCESSDIFARDIALPRIKRGDILTLKSAGAYGSAMASNYNLHDHNPPLYSDDL